MGAPKATDTPAAAAADNTCTESNRHQCPGTKEPNAGSSGLSPCPCQAQAKGHSKPPRAYFPALGFVLPVLGEEVAKDIAAAAGDVNQGAFLAQAQARRDSQHQGDRLDEQRPLAQVASDDEAAENGFDLGGRKAPSWEAGLDPSAPSAGPIRSPW